MDTNIRLLKSKDNVLTEGSRYIFGAIKEAAVAVSIDIDLTEREATIQLHFGTEEEIHHTVDQQVTGLHTATQMYDMSKLPADQEEFAQAINSLVGLALENSDLPEYLTALTEVYDMELAELEEHEYLDVMNMIAPVKKESKNKDMNKALAKAGVKILN